MQHYYCTQYWSPIKDQIQVQVQQACPLVEINEDSQNIVNCMSF